MLLIFSFLFGHVGVKKKKMPRGLRISRQIISSALATRHPELGRNSFASGPRSQALGIPSPTPGATGDHMAQIRLIPPPKQMKTEKVCLCSAVGGGDAPQPASRSRRRVSIASVRSSPPSARNVNFCARGSPLPLPSSRLLTSKDALHVANALWRGAKNGRRCYTIILETLHCVLTEGRRPG